jgi:hypothetical protein
MFEAPGSEDYRRTGTPIRKLTVEPQRVLNALLTLFLRRSMPVPLNVTSMTGSQTSIVKD